VTLKILNVGGRTVKICDQYACVYHEPTEDQDLGLGYVGVEV